LPANVNLASGTLAVCIRYVGHCLNLAINHSIQVIPITNIFTLVAENINFVNESPKRRSPFEIDLLSVQKHDALLRFVSKLPANREWIEDMSKRNVTRSKTCSKANSLP